MSEQIIKQNMGIQKPFLQRLTFLTNIFNVFMLKMNNRLNLSLYQVSQFAIFLIPSLSCII